MLQCGDQRQHRQEHDHSDRVIDPPVEAICSWTEGASRPGLGRKKSKQGVNEIPGVRGQPGGQRGLNIYMLVEALVSRNGARLALTSKSG